MYRLESKILQREFKVHEGYLYASQIRNVLSRMDFIPDGNSVEFLFRFTDGTEFSSKGMTVKDSTFENGVLTFIYNENMGVSVKLSFWAGEDGNTLKKQITFTQKNDKVIDYILLEHVGIINSKAHFCVPVDVDGEQTPLRASLGQPFYIDSLFFGCEFPATHNAIVFGVGQVKYFLGRHIDGEFSCPVTVVGGAKSRELLDVQRAFYDYINSIAVGTDFCVNYNSWFDHKYNINADNLQKAFFEVEKQLSQNGVPPINAYVVDDGWNDYRKPFWTFNRKFPNQLYDLSDITSRFSSGIGLWLSPRGGYDRQDKFAKRLEKKGFGAYNANGGDICIADRTYQKNLCDFLVKSTKEFDIDYWKLDGFMLNPCTNERHGHMVGGEDDMYEITELWENWIEIFRAVRKARSKQGRNIRITLGNYTFPSPWWLQYVNSLWLQNCDDIVFAENNENQSKLDAELTYRDSRYYDFFCTRAYQVPVKYIFNHEPVYGKMAGVEYTDEEFEKYLYFNACRGAALNELYISYSIMNKAKWRTLSNVLKWQKSNFDILENMTFLGGKPDENNIYGYFGWNADGDGIVALRNPTDEKTSLTLTFNKLMGCPESMNKVQRYNVYNVGAGESYDSYSYGDKLDLTLKPFEVKIFQFGKRDRRYDYLEGVDEFTLRFNYKGEENIDICDNGDISVKVRKGCVQVNCAGCELVSPSILSGNNHKITVVREKNKMVKLYIDSGFDWSAYDGNAKGELDLNIECSADGFELRKKATAYDELITLREILGKKRKK